MKIGNLVVVEGACDGIGKTTQYAKLYERLKYEGKTIVTHHFPSYNTYHGAPVERYLSGELGDKSDISPYLVHSLYAIDRGIVWHTKLKPAYEDGAFILLDRYTTSSLIYQAACFDSLEEQKEFVDYVIDFEYNKLWIREPDNVIFLKAPFDLVTKIRNARKSNEGISNDIHERDIQFMKKVYDTSMFVADYLSWDQIECSDGDKMRSEDDIHEEVYELVKKRNSN